MWGYVFLAEFYVGADEDALYDSEFYTYCDSIWDWFVSTLHQGLRLGGGIGEGLGKVPIEEDKYTNRIIFDLLFFIIMIIILLNIVFGIIIDTFAELRDNRKQQSKQLNTIWFICGVDRL